MNAHKSLDTLERIETLAAVARRESLPSVEVSGAVLRRLRTQAAPLGTRQLAWTAVGALAAAAIVLAVSVPYVNGALDPLSTYFEIAADSPI